MCDHDDDKGKTFLDWFPVGEVYMCECGALIDIDDEHNFRDGDELNAMTPDELKSAFRAYGDEIKAKIIAAVRDIDLRP